MALLMLGNYNHFIWFKNEVVGTLLDPNDMIQSVSYVLRELNVQGHIKFLWY